MIRISRRAVPALIATLASASAMTPALAQSPDEIAQALIGVLPAEAGEAITYDPPRLEGDVVIIPNVRVGGAETTVVPGREGSVEIPMLAASVLSIGSIELTNATLDEGTLLADAMTISDVSADGGDFHVSIAEIAATGVALPPYAEFAAYMTLIEEDLLEALNSSMSQEPYFTTLQVSDIIVSVDGEPVAAIEAISGSSSMVAQPASSTFAIEGIEVLIPPEELGEDTLEMFQALGVEGLVFNVGGTATYDLDTGDMALDRLTFEAVGLARLVISLALDGMTPERLVALATGDTEGVPSRIAFSVDELSFAVPIAVLDPEAAMGLAALGLEELAVTAMGGLDWNVETGRFALENVGLDVAGLGQLAITLLIDGLTPESLMALEEGDPAALPDRVFFSIDTANVSLPAAMLDEEDLPLAAMGLDELNASIAGTLDWDLAAGTLVLDGVDLSIDGLARLAFSLTVEGVTAEMMMASAEGDGDAEEMLPTAISVQLEEASVTVPIEALPPEVAAMAAPLGLEAIDVMISGDIDWDAETGDFAIADLTFDVGGFGTTTVSLDMEGMTPQALAMLELMGSGDIPNSALSPLLAQLTQVTISDFEIRYDDAGGTAGLLGFVAAMEGASAEEVRAELLGAAEVALATVEDPAQRDQIMAALQAFLADPQSLVVRADPPVPVSLADVYLIGNGLPGLLIGPFILNVSVEANGE